jgi:hypothetical protein
VLRELGRLRRGRCEGLEGKGVCLGGFCGWCGSFQANRGSFYRREREHGARGSAARARLVSATEGEGRSGLSAEGCGGLQALPGALVGCGVVWCRGGKGGVLRWFSSVLPCLTAVVWAGETGDRQQGDRGHCGKDMGTPEVSLHCLQTVLALLLNPAH